MISPILLCILGIFLSCIKDNNSEPDNNEPTSQTSPHPRQRQRQQLEQHIPLPLYTHSDPIQSHIDIPLDPIQYRFRPVHINQNIIQFLVIPIT